jgi:phenylpropionate dioxygenase-like ring-hydroxylating dioxygenase large terminal subunit
MTPGDTQSGNTASGDAASGAASGSAPPGIPADWARTLTDPHAFRREQDRLTHIWTFLGLTRDAARDGDWFRASLATRSVFVQRFGGDLKGFENRCVHRGYPLRNADTGSGPIVCGFHHWRYDEDGRALGIPLCDELFGKIPRDLDARLNPIEIATCGTLVFGRFPSAGATDSLEAFLGPGFPILQAMSQMNAPPIIVSNAVKANWKLCLHITFDDYHGVAVHPGTFGKLGYVRRQNITYARFGLHSASLNHPDPQALEKMAAACRDGSFRSAYYRIFQIMPNLIVSHFRSDGHFWYCLVQQYVPLAHDRSQIRAWVYPAPFPADRTPLEERTRRLTDPVRRLAVGHYFRQIAREDHAVCERIQEIAHQIDGPPLIGALEERIVWFEESYRRIMAGGEARESTSPAAVARAAALGVRPLTP